MQYPYSFDLPVPWSQLSHASPLDSCTRCKGLLQLYRQSLTRFPAPPLSYPLLSYFFFLCSLFFRSESAEATVDKGREGGSNSPARSTSSFDTRCSAAERGREGPGENLPVKLEVDRGVRLSRRRLPPPFCIPTINREFTPNASGITSSRSPFDCLLKRTVLHSFLVRRASCRFWRWNGPIVGAGAAVVEPPLFGQCSAKCRLANG